MRNVFKTKELEDQFDKEGVAYVDLLNKEEFLELQSLLEELKKAKISDRVNVDSSYKLSFFSSDSDYRKTVFERISGFFLEKVNRYLDNYKPLIINVFDKESGGGEVPIHQNWTFVDEDEYSSVSVWIPMVDVSRENGTLEIVKGSHRVLAKYRSPTIPWVFDGLWSVLKEKYFEPILIKKGQAGILDDSILHYSSSNDSDAVRTTVQLIMVPADATPLHYYRKPDEPDKLEVYKVDSDFFTSFNMKEKPSGVPKIDEIDYKYEQLSEEEMVERIEVNYPKVRTLYQAGIPNEI